MANTNKFTDAYRPSATPEKNISVNTIMTQSGGGGGGGGIEGDDMRHTVHSHVIHCV